MKRRESDAMSRPGAHTPADADSRSRPSGLHAPRCGLAVTSPAARASSAPLTPAVDRE